MKAVRWSVAQAGSRRVTGVIGADGGTLAIPAADFRIVFPSGALMQPTTITIIADSTGFIGYEMLPHGLQFLRPVTVVQGLGKASKKDRVFGAYVPSDYVASDGSATVTEVEYSQTFYRDGDTYQTWTLLHFSRYILAGEWYDDGQPET